jgi:hypothetical protein
MPTTTLSQLLTELAPTLTAAATAGNTGVVGAIAGLFHIGTGGTTTGLDFKNKTMTASWEAANTQTAITLYATGWTLIPG